MPHDGRLHFLYARFFYGTNCIHSRRLTWCITYYAVYVFAFKDTLLTLSEDTLLTCFVDYLL